MRRRALLLLFACAAVAVSTLIVWTAVTNANLTDVAREHRALTEAIAVQHQHQAILDYVVLRNPHAPLKAFRAWPETLLSEARRADLDHCLLLAQAEVESSFRHDVVGSAGEIGLFQILPATAAFFEKALGPFARPQLTRAHRELGDLGNPVINTRFAVAYLRDLLRTHPRTFDALARYNGGVRNPQPTYARLVFGTYVEILEQPALGCRYQRPSATTSPPPAEISPFFRLARL